MLIALTLICLALIAVIVLERRDHQKQTSLLMTRIQAPSQAMALTPLPEDDGKQWLSEEDEELEHAA